jgi:hypothetical protein
MNRSSWWAYALHRPLGGRIISLGESTVLHLQNPQKASSWLWLTTNFAEPRLAELRLIRLLRSSHRLMSRRRAHQFLKLGNLSAGVAAVRAPGHIRVPAPAPGTRTSPEPRGWRLRACARPPEGALWVRYLSGLPRRQTIALVTKTRGVLKGCPDIGTRYKDLPFFVPHSSHTPTT